MKMDGRSQLLTPGEVALMFRVDPKTVTRWASAGRIGSVRTPGGHRRFLKADIDVLLDRLTTDRSSAESRQQNQQLALSSAQHGD
jgi:excisionase family DNA binding protein